MEFVNKNETKFEIRNRDILPLQWMYRAHFLNTLNFQVSYSTT